jgi:hypothetical protein
LPEEFKPFEGVTERWPGGMALKFATTFLGLFMVMEAGLTDPERSPDQFEKLYPALAVAETEKVCPLLYQFVPEGLTVPAPDGLTEVVRVCWVVKSAV